MVRRAPKHAGVLAKQRDMCERQCIKCWINEGTPIWTYPHGMCNINILLGSCKGDTSRWK